MSPPPNRGPNRPGMPPRVPTPQSARMTAQHGKHRKLFPHKKSKPSGGNQGQLAGMVNDAASQAAKLHNAVQTASGSAPLQDLLAQATNLNSVITALQAIAKSISTDIVALQSTSSGSPQPQPQPAPAPKPVPPSGGSTNTNPPGPASTIAWPSFTGTDALVGKSSSGNVAVYIDASMWSNAQAMANATALVSDADRVLAENQSIFGLPAKPSRVINVLLYAMSGENDGTGGADHMGCTLDTGGDIEVDFSFDAPMRASGLFEAELSEAVMGGQMCGYSNGEALSRWCAMVVSGNALADFDTAPGWQSDGLVNWVDKTLYTDEDPDSIGCGMAFISYLLHRGATLPQIAQAMVATAAAGPAQTSEGSEDPSTADDGVEGGTLAQLYQDLGMGAVTLAWPTFKSAVDALGTITSDDPFGQAPTAMVKGHAHV